jgi:hypothetical protein
MDVAHVVLLVLHIGGILALLAGLLLQVRHPEKKVVGLVVLVLVMANLRKPRIPDGLYWSLLVLTLADVGVALLWG